MSRRPRPFRRPASAVALVALAACLALAGCGDDKREGPGSSDQSTDLPVKPPRGWRTVTNRGAGFTVAVPRDWPVRTRATATLIRSRDRLLALSVAADRSEHGRRLPAQRYAETALRSLPGFHGVRVKRARRVKGTPYESGRLDATGILRTKRRRERVSVAVLRVPRRVSYVLIGFRNAKVPARVHDPLLDQVLSTFRARAPDAG